MKQERKLTELGLVLTNQRTYLNYLLAERAKWEAELRGLYSNTTKDEIKRITIEIERVLASEGSDV